MHLKCACQTCFSGFRLGSLLVLGRPLALSQTLAHLGLFHCTSILKRGHQMPQRMLQARTLSDRNTSCLILEHDPVCNIDFDPVLLKFLLIWQFLFFLKVGAPCASTLQLCWKCIVLSLKLLILNAPLTRVFTLLQANKLELALVKTQTRARLLYTLLQAKLLSRDYSSGPVAWNSFPMAWGSCTAASWPLRILWQHPFAYLRRASNLLSPTTLALALSDLVKSLIKQCRCQC
jgi:hypothetical protein